MSLLSVKESYFGLVIKNLELMTVLDLKLY